MNSRRSSKKSQPNTSNSKTPNEKQQDNQDKLFPVVGIGASAGGLQAFTQLISCLPINTGMAFVIIQHMPAQHESSLSAILSRSTQMPVHQVYDGTPVGQDQVYVIPPNSAMTIVEGMLRLSPRPRTSQAFMSVDTFLISLAQERGNKAIGVILSGGDSDGAKGIEAIKAAGGVTFAQCEDTAQVDSMPNTAVATGVVDFILPPQQIAQKLAELSDHPYIADQPTSKEEADEPLDTNQDAIAIIFSLLRAATGVDFTHYKQTTLNRRIQRRMFLYKVEQLEDYARYLQNNSTEVMALYQDALIHVTSFFRDPESFDALKSKVFPIIAKDKSPGTPIRIWVAGCSTGEEAYSIAICLLEFFAEQVPRLPIQIYATDISDTAIEHARSGIYTPSQVANVSPERLHRFFIQVEGVYQITKSVRELCVFARQNLIGDPPFSRLDLISCRNVLIYLGTPLQKKLLPIFHYGLKPAGFLMLGTSETVGDFLDLFSLIDKKNKIYAKKLVSTNISIDLTTNFYAPAIINPPPLMLEETSDDLEIQKEADRIVLNQYAPAGIVIDTNLEILQFRGHTSPYLEPAPGKASLNLLKMAKEGLRLELRTAIHQAKQQKLPFKRDGLQMKEGDHMRHLTINVIPFQTKAPVKEYFLILFEDVPFIPAVPIETNDGNVNSRVKTRDAQEIARLRQELETTKQHLQSIIEEQQATNQDLRAANEEILSSNEELQSTNEELETAKEEIQAANEELNTINDELRRRNLEVTQVSNDLQNLLSSINIPILMLGGDLRIRQFTPAVEGIFNLISTDVGRPLSDINHNLNMPNLEQQILEVIRTLNLKTQEIQDREGHWYELRIRPYRTIDNKIDGAVVVLVDIDQLKHSSSS
jgi:two-component system CheB/CheR fusion protein